MSLTMYEASIPVFIRYLGNLSALLEKAEAHAKELSFDPANFVESRLIADMDPLRSQIQRASDSAKGCGARLAGVDIPSFPDTEKTLSELQERITKTVDFLKSIKPADIDGSADREVILKMRRGPVNFTGRSYLFNFALPNFLFHVTTAYAILRANGVKIGKLDYLGGL
ncbi:DUF1993 family protein [Chelatococcus sp. GCM10030263]|uniref:DUF1993 domain-containing protein n=1 Tax=Chelatococcus sp. GCM10030263 TaxID=3273387 RepID=UPI00361A3383